MKNAQYRLWKISKSKFEKQRQPRTIKQHTSP